MGTARAEEKKFYNIGSAAELWKLFLASKSFAVTHFLLELVEFFLELLELQNPGLMVMGEDSCSEGRGFKSQHCILDGHFFTYLCCKNCNK